MKRLAALMLLAIAACRVADQTVIIADCEQPYEDARHLLALPAGATSHWLQPWRAYQDTWPAARFLSALGTGVDPRGLASDDARDRAARHLAAAGFARAAFEISWNQMDGANPNRLDAPAAVAWLAAVRAHGLRPSVLLNAHEGGPMPAVTFDAVLTAPASKGADRVQVDDATFARIVPHRTGLDFVSRNVAAEVLFVAKDAATKTVTLSKKLPAELNAGPHGARTLAYRPFFRPRDAAGAAQPSFEDTMRGWLSYVGAVATAIKQGIGGNEFDVQVWNISGPASPSAILDVNNYYDVPVDSAPGDAYVVTAREILARTAAFLGKPGSGFEGVRVVDGFASRDFGVTAADEPAFVSAVGRDLVVRPRRFPRDQAPARATSVDALFREEGVRDADGLWTAYAPTYGTAFPEVFLSAVAPESLTPDLAPFETSSSLSSSLSSSSPANRRGRAVTGAGGVPPSVWITALSQPAVTSVEPAPTWEPGDAARLRATIALRAALAYVGKGVEALFFYRFADGGGLDQTADTGAAARALARTAAALHAPGPPTTARRLDLQSVETCDAGAQLEGDGTPAHPRLYDRDVVAFFPFQVTDTRFVAAAYVMTRDVGLTQPARRFVLRFRGVRGGAARVAALDPVTGLASHVEVLSSSSNAVEMAVTLDGSPRLITIDDG